MDVIQGRRKLWQTEQRWLPVLPSHVAGGRRDDVREHLRVGGLRPGKLEGGRHDRLPSPVSGDDRVRMDIGIGWLEIGWTERRRQGGLPAPRPGEQGGAGVESSFWMVDLPEPRRSVGFPSPRLHVAGDGVDLQSQVVQGGSLRVPAGGHGQHAAQRGISRSHELGSLDLLVDCSVQSGGERLRFVRLRDGCCEDHGSRAGCIERDEQVVEDCGGADRAADGGGVHIAECDE